MLLKNVVLNSSIYNGIFDHNDKKKATRVETKTKKLSKLRVRQHNFCND